MLIQDIVEKYIKQGHNFRNAQNLAAEEIVINKISSSSLSEYVTLKGGIVMYNLTKNNRRVTQDIDFDLIRYSIDETSIRLFVKKMNNINDGITASVLGEIEPLHQEDYRGVRIHLLLSDIKNDKLRIKLDIGVHTYTAIKQERIAFCFDSEKDSISMKVNPCEQIFAEKLISLARLGPISTRYKDIYDLFYFIKNNLIDVDSLRNILELFLSSSMRKPNTIDELVDSIVNTLNNAAFAKEANKPASKWIDEDYGAVKDAITKFVEVL